jgi:alpha-L-rhamnosidase
VANYPSLLRPSTPLPPVRASFCWHRSGLGQGYEVGLFRREFTVTDPSVTRRIAITADNRYVLRLNGQIIGRGPLRGTLESYQVEIYDLTPLLQPGLNVLAAEVRWMGIDTPASEIHTPWPGWWVQDIDSTELDTPGDWIAYSDPSVRPNLAPPFANAHTFLGRLDRVEPALRPTNWDQLPTPDANGWNKAVSNGPPARSPGWGIIPLRQLAARDLPAVSEYPGSFAAAYQERQPVSLPWTVAAGETAELWLDVGTMTTSYPRLTFQGGRGREIHVVYAEALGRWEDAGQGTRWIKSGRRDDLAHDEPHGVRDELWLPGDTWTFESFHWRTFRYIKVVVGPGSEAVTLSAADHRVTHFPYHVTANFRCAEPDADRWWDISVRTLRLCAHETYEDCPYYEQLNYVADTLLQARSAYYLTNDTRLSRRCLELFRDSIGAEGLTGARVPSQPRQIIPPFSLMWIQMVADYWQWRGEPEKELIRSCLPVIDQMLTHFSQHLTETGLLGPTNYWSWTDWVKQWPHGVPPAAHDPAGNTVFSGLLVVALNAASALHLAVGEADTSHHWTRLARRVRRAIHRETWSESAGLFLEGPQQPTTTFSQHAQTMAVLSGAADARQRRRLADRLIGDDSLVPMSLSQRFWLARALERIGRYDVLFSKVLAPWRTMAANGLSTWQECEDPSRSDCHGWSAWMVHDFFASILGATAAAPGWTHINIEPQWSVTQLASGSFDCPTGRISVEWSKDPKSKTLELRLATPPGVPVTVRIPGCEPMELPDGANGCWVFPLRKRTSKKSRTPAVATQ